MHAYHIQSATVADIPTIQQLTYKVWPQTYASIISAEQIDYMLKMMYSTAALEQQMEAGCQFIILRDEQDPVGFASFQSMGDGHFKLHKLYVLATQQGKGAGKFLVDYIESSAHEQGGRFIELQVNRHNNAKSFYEKVGFHVREEKAFAIGEGYVMDDYIMEKSIG